MGSRCVASAWSMPALPITVRMGRARRLYCLAWNPVSITAGLSAQMHATAAASSESRKRKRASVNNSTVVMAAMTMFSVGPVHVCTPNSTHQMCRSQKYSGG